MKRATAIVSWAMFLLAAFSTNPYPLEVKYRETVANFINAVKTNDKSIIAGQVAYPFGA